MKAAEHKPASISQIQKKSETPFFDHRSEQEQPFFASNESVGSEAFFSPSSPISKGGIIQSKLTVGQPNDVYEQEADSVADKVVQHLHKSTGADDPTIPNSNDSINIQRKCADCTAEEETVQRMPLNTEGGISSDIEPPSTSDETPTDGQTRFIVDDAETPAAGQMQKSVFLTRLNDDVCQTVNDALAGTPFTSDNCPYLRAVFARHQNSTPLYLEQVMVRYEPAIQFAQSVEEVIQFVKMRVFTAALRWLQTGDLSDVPQEEATDDMPDNPNSENAPNDATLETSGNDNLFFKAKEGGAETTQSPLSVMRSLGEGNSIESSTRSKMEGAFGTSFSDVEVHTDSHAASLASGMNARAFAVGNHIAFGSGEHQPGSLIGDALMAHELAHVEQQRGATVQTKSNTDNQLIEKDADETAVGVMAKSITGEDIDLQGKESKGLKTGLRLSSCNRCSQDEVVPTPVPIPGLTPTPTPTPTPSPTPAQITGCEGSRNRDAAIRIINQNPRNYPTAVQMYLHALQSGERIATLANDTFRDNNVTLAGHLTPELTALNSHINPSRIRPGDCVILIRHWTHPNIGTLPTAPAATALTPEVIHTIATIYGEQWNASANAQEQQRYIWFSIRRRIETSLRGSTLTSVVHAGEYHAINGDLYNAALGELNSGNIRTQAVINIRDMVLANWTNPLPADAGAFYFHWTDRSTSQRCFNNRTNQSIDVATRERNCAWDWASQQGWTASIPRTAGWLKRIRGEGSGQIGSMYIYSGF